MDEPANESLAANPDTTPGAEPGESTSPESIVGRSVFLVETVAAGVSVRTMFLAEDQRLIEMPAVFPDLPYALTQIEELKRIVEQHFAQAARIGAQVIASQSSAAAQTVPQAAPQSDAPAPVISAA